MQRMSILLRLVQQSKKAETLNPIPTRLPKYHWGDLNNQRRERHGRPVLLPGETRVTSDSLRIAGLDTSDKREMGHVSQSQNTRRHVDMSRRTRRQSTRAISRIRIAVHRRNRHRVIYRP